jgi:hypothetical protein
VNKKEAKKTLLVRGGTDSAPTGNQSFFASFCSQKEVVTSLPS